MPMQSLSLRSKKSFAALMLGFVFLVPYQSYAATTWQPRTNAELIAFLYGVVAQLQIQLDALRSGSGSDSSYDGGDDSYGNDSTTGRPHVSTGNTDYLTANSVSVEMDVDTKSYGYSNAFFVYGTSQTKVNAAAREDAFADIEIEDGLNRFSVNNGFSGKATLNSSLYGLTASTKYYYRACLEYVVDERDDDTKLTCGDVETFTTKRR